jgi:uncharacterized protein YjiS (DUF1127 family)
MVLVSEAIVPIHPKREIDMNTMSLIVGARARGTLDLGFLLRGVFASMANQRRIRRDVAFLMQQDERLLSDIGLSRCDVTRAVRGRF